MAETKEKKPRKPRKDKGKKRGKRTKNPRLQTGSIDFRTIGTNAISGPNLTSLIGTLASLPRQVQPNLPQPPDTKEQQKKTIQDIISTELAKYAPRDLAKQNFPQPPQERADVEQSQEENLDDAQRQIIEQMRRQQGNAIRNLRTQLEGKIEDIEETNYFLREFGNEQEQYVNELKKQLKKDLVEREKKVKLAETENATLKGQMLGLEGNIADLKSQMESMKSSSVSKAEYEMNVKELRKQLQEKEKSLKYYKEEEAKSLKTIGQQQLELISARSPEKQQQAEKYREEAQRYQQQAEFQRDQFEEERQALKGKLIEAEAQRDLIRQIAIQQEEEYNEEARVSNEIVGMMAEDIVGQREAKISALQQSRYQSGLLREADVPRILFGNETGYKDISTIDEEEHQQLMRELSGNGPRIGASMPVVSELQAEEEFDIDAINAMLRKQADEQTEIGSLGSLDTDPYDIDPNEEPYDWEDYNSRMA